MAKNIAIETKKGKKRKVEKSKKFWKEFLKSKKNDRKSLFIGRDDSGDCGAGPRAETDRHSIGQSKIRKGSGQLCGTTLGNGGPVEEDQAEGVRASR